MENSELVVFKESAMATLNRVNELHVHLDSVLAKRLRALEVETNNHIN